MGTMIPSKKNSTRNATARLDRFMDTLDSKPKIIKRSAFITMGILAFRRLLELGDITELELDQLISSTDFYTNLESPVDDGESEFDFNAIRKVEGDAN